MEKKQANVVMILGIAANVLLLVFFGWMYWISIPQESELNPIAMVVKPEVYNQALDQELNSLNKVSDLPINVNPNELGKQNPYNF